MSDGSERTGSRYLYAPFEVANARIEANERVAEERWAALSYRLERIEISQERVERRLWLAVYGVVAVILAQGVTSLLAVAP
ncbi:MAG: GTA head formation protein, RCAP_rcc01685 family [Paracoccaceae bacterium]